jgi:AraC family transcriptional regulator
MGSSALPDIRTHGIVSQPGNRVRASSAGLGWRSLWASTQREVPFDGEYQPVDDHLLVFHVDGPVRVEGSVGEHRSDSVIPAGYLFLWPGGQGFRVRLNSPLDTLHLYVRRSMVDEVADTLGMGDGGIELEPCLGEADPLLDAFARELRGTIASGDPNGALYAEHIGRAMAARLARSYSSRPARNDFHGGGLSRSQLDRVKEHIDAHLDGRIELDDLAAAAGLSASWFVRRFKQATGTPPHRFVQQRRIARAQRLLAETSLGIAEIALDCGFCHQEHLTRAFRRQVGVTPGAWRRAVRG